MGNVRVRGHDYRGKGYYFITFGTLNRRRVLSRIVGGRVELKPAGERLMEAWRKIAEEDPAYELGVSAVMPDHFHGLAIVRKAPKYVIGTHVSRVEGRVLHAMRKELNDPDLKLWDEGFYDYLSLDMKMLRAFENYIRDNPRRWQLRQDHPDLFVRVNQLRHTRLPADESWAGYGNLFLIEKPELLPVQVSRRASPDELHELKAQVAARTTEGAVMVSPFISPGEKEIAKMVMEQERGSLILIRPEGFPPQYKPSGAYFDLCAQGRLLVLTAFTHGGRKQALTRECCLRMNGWVKAICAESTAMHCVPR